MGTQGVIWTKLGLRFLGANCKRQLLTGKKTAGENRDDAAHKDSDQAPLSVFASPAQGLE